MRVYLLGVMGVADIVVVAELSHTPHDIMESKAHQVYQGQKLNLVVLSIKNRSLYFGTGANGQLNSAI